MRYICDRAVCAGRVPESNVKLQTPMTTRSHSAVYNSDGRSKGTATVTTIIGRNPIAALRRVQAPAKGTLLIALIFTGLVVLWEIVVFRVDYVRTFTGILSQTYRVWEADMIAQLVLIAMCIMALAVIYVHVALTSGRLVRLAAFLIFAFAMVYEYGYMNTL